MPRHHRGFVPQCEGASYAALTAAVQIAGRWSVAMVGLAAARLRPILRVAFALPHPGNREFRRAESLGYAALARATLAATVALA
jgi:hypothetical protein